MIRPATPTPHLSPCLRAPPQDLRKFLRAAAPARSCKAQHIKIPPRSTFRTLFAPVWHDPSQAIARWGRAFIVLTASSKCSICGDAFPCNQCPASLRICTPSVVVRTHPIRPCIRESPDHHGTTIQVWDTMPCACGARNSDHISPLLFRPCVLANMLSSESTPLPYRRIREAFVVGHHPRLPHLTPRSPLRGRWTYKHPHVGGVVLSASQNRSDPLASISHIHLRNHAVTAHSSLGPEYLFARSPVLPTASPY